jgi:alkylation response protein AidB-like acyl-CoA dehydrogenase
MHGGRYNEVFFQDVRLPRTAIVGEFDRGWYTVAHNLDFERSGIERAVHQQMLFDELMAFAREQDLPSVRDPIIRHRVAQTALDIAICRLLSYRIAWIQASGRIPNHEASIAKLFGSEVDQRSMGVFLQVLGQQGSLTRDSKYAMLRGKMARHYLYAVSKTIAAGTSEIQRNIIATRGLGLPRG